MTSGRTSKPRDPVTITLDGEPVIAERGEPIAAALVAAGKLTIARSPKFHRPRGPSCMRAACDGCLARVNGTPNMMTCMIAAEEGTAIVSQNHFGVREVDLLRMTDWFFPEGMNHHELFAGVVGVQSVMQAFARRVAGLGKLPTETSSPKPAARREVDALVVGSGPSGMAVASRLAEAGRSVEVIDDQLSPGGALLALTGKASEPFEAIRAPFMDHVTRKRIHLQCSTVAGGMYEDDILIVGPEGASIVTATSLVFASGAHDGALAFEDNDMPGILSARAGGLLLARGVVPGERIVVVVSEGGGPFGEAYVRALESAVGNNGITVSLVRGQPVRANGSSRPKSIVVRDSKGHEKEHVADAILIDAPRCPSYELAAQAGARLAHEPRGFVVVTDGGRIRRGIYAVGELVGVPLEAEPIKADAARAADAIAQDVAASSP